MKWKLQCEHLSKKKDHEEERSKGPNLEDCQGCEIKPHFQKEGREIMT